MPDKMLKFTDIDQQSPTKREVSIRKDDFSEIYGEYIHKKAYYEWKVLLQRSMMESFQIVM